MRKRLFLTSVLILAVVLPLTAVNVEAGLQDQIENLVKTAIEKLPIDAADLVAASGLKCSPLRGLVDLDLRLSPVSLKKRAGRIEFLSLDTIRATAVFDFAGHYDLLANGRSVSASDISMIGEGAVNISFRGLKITIDDIPSLVLKLADRPGDCPDMGRIEREPKRVNSGGTYQVSTTVTANHPGHVAYFIFANNKAAAGSDPTLRTSIGQKIVNYSAPVLVRDDARADRYFGNVMAVEIVSRTNNPLDLNSYEVLFTTGITMIEVQ